MFHNGINVKISCRHLVNKIIKMLNGQKALIKVSPASENAVTTFKKPALVKKKQKILTEDKYIEEMGKIIQRDFFPDLDRLRAQNEYLDAMDRKDYTQMEVLRAKYSGCRPTDRSGSVTPATFETPLISTSHNTPTANETRNRTPNPADAPKSTKSESNLSTISEQCSLDLFLQKYTSEDNQSFQEIMERADERLRKKYDVFYRNEQLSVDQLARALKLPSIEDQFQESKEPRPIETWTYKNKNSVMYSPAGVELTIEEQIDAASKRQNIQHNATRLSTNPFNELSSPTPGGSIAKKALQSGKIGLDGNVVTLKNVNEGDEVRVNGFDFLRTPSPRPGEAFSPLMTWGEIEGTPFRLDGGDNTPLPHSSASGPHFKISENTRRESIALALAERAGEKMRAQKQKAVDTARKNMAQRSTPFIRSNIDRLASMSPAARKLATGKLGLGTPLISVSATHFATPRNIDRPKSIVNRKPTNKTTIDSNSTRHKNNQTNNASNTETLTDNLLQIPSKRLSASDFF